MPSTTLGIESISSPVTTTLDPSIHTSCNRQSNQPKLIVSIVLSYILTGGLQLPASIAPKMATRTTADAYKTDLHITKLPMEILCQLPYMLDSIDDLYALLSTSRIFYQACAGSSAKLAPSRSMEKRLTLAGTARQIADWAVQSTSHRTRFTYILEKGSPGMLQLAFKIARFNLSEIRALHDSKKTIITPLAEKLLRDCTLCQIGRFYKVGSSFRALEEPRNMFSERLLETYAFCLRTLV